MPIVLDAARHRHILICEKELFDKVQVLSVGTTVNYLQHQKAEAARRTLAFLGLPAGLGRRSPGHTLAWRYLRGPHSADR